MSFYRIVSLSRKPHLTFKAPGVLVTHLPDLRGMKGWLDLGVTQWFWTQDSWIENRALQPQGHLEFFLYILLFLKNPLIKSNFMKWFLIFWAENLVCWSHLVFILLLKGCYHPSGHFPAGNYMFELNNRSTRTRCEICSKLRIKTPERPHWRSSCVFIVNFQHISHFVLAFLLLTLNR